jgi:hypothetical protein
LEQGALVGILTLVPSAYLTFAVNVQPPEGHVFGVRMTVFLVFLLVSALVLSWKLVRIASCGSP